MNGSYHEHSKCTKEYTEGYESLIRWGLRPEWCPYEEGSIEWLNWTLGREDKEKFLGPVMDWRC